MAQIKLNAQTNSATGLGLSGLFKSSVTCIYIVLFLSQTVTCSLWGYIELVSFSHCTSTTIVLHLNSLISFWYHDVISTEMYCDCLENLVIMPRQSQAALPKLASWLDTLLCCTVSSTSISEPSLVLWTDNAMYFYIFWTRFTLLLAESICAWEIRSLGNLIVLVTCKSAVAGKGHRQGWFSYVSVSPWLYSVENLLWSLVMIKTTCWKIPLGQ